MADLPTSQLPALPSITGAEFIPAEIGGSTFKQTNDQLSDYVLAKTHVTTTNEIFTNKQATKIMLSTSVLEGGTLSAGTNANTFKVAATKGIIVDFTNPFDPTITYVNVAEQDNIAPAFINTGLPVSVIYMDGNGNIVQPNFPIPRTLVLDNLLLGFIEHLQIGVVTKISDFPLNMSANLGHKVLDLFTGIGLNAVGTGLQLRFNGPTLTFSISAGEITGYFLGDPDDPRIPTRQSIPAMAGDPILYVWRDGMGGFKTLFQVSGQIIPGSYDDGTGGDSLPNGTVSTNRFSIHRVYLSSDGAQAVVFGQDTYANIDDAVAATQTEEYEEPLLVLEYLFRGWLIVKGNATSLIDASQARRRFGPNNGRY